MKELIYDDSKYTRLDHYLKEMLPDISRTKIQKLIKFGLIRVDDFIVKPSFVLKNKVVVSYDDSSTLDKDENLYPEKMDLDIIYEDSHIAVINKPAGTVVHPGIGNRSGTLLNGMLYHFDKLSTIDNHRPGVIHRLDKFTSGIIVFAKTDMSHYFISNQFAERKVKKKYKALVWGKVTSSGKIEGYIKRDPYNRLAFITDKNKGKLSSTSFEILGNYNIPISLLNVFPHTGRTHQIRVHLASIGHSIINDSMYGGSEKKIKSFHSKYSSKFKKVIKIIDRVGLHASSIEFFHPKDKNKVLFEAPLPNDFLNAIKTLESYEQ